MTLRYRVDLVVVAMFAGSILDAGTTWVIVSRHIGFETNPTLALLIRHSLIWIPIYLLLGPSLVPLFPEICRFAFSVYFASAGLAFGTNNLAGIFYGRYFLIGAIGFPVLQGICIFLGVAVFIRRVWKLVGSAGDWWRDVGLWASAFSFRNFIRSPLPEIV